MNFRKDGKAGIMNFATIARNCYINFRFWKVQFLCFLPCFHRKGQNHANFANHNLHKESRFPQKAPGCDGYEMC